MPTAMLGLPGEYAPEIVMADGVRSFRVGPYRMPIRPGDFTAGTVRSDPHVLIEDMDRKGIDIVGVTVSAGFYLYWADRATGVAFSRVHNDALAEFCRPYPDRLFFIPTLPLQDIAASLDEMDRAIHQLGGRGINLGTEDLAGRDLDSEELWPVYERAQRYEAPVFLHPSGRSGPEEPPVSRYNLASVVGFICQETAAVAVLMFGGVLDAFPDLRIIVAHGGGAAPYQWGRLERAAGSQPDIKAKKPLREYLKNFYFDLLVHDLPARQFLVNFMGADHVVQGDNYAGWDHADGFQFIDELDLSERDRQKIRSGNAVRLFHL
jgi:aminocarboxymuconate-semialdehyde decarboxylase